MTEISTKKLTAAFATIASFFEMNETRTDREGKDYVFNHLFFSQKNTLQSMIWSTERRLADLHALEIRGEYGMKKPNTYGLPYAVKRLEAAMRSNNNGELDIEAINQATEQLERVHEEIAHCNAFLDALVAFFDDKYAVITKRRNFEVGVATEAERTDAQQNAIAAATAALAKLGGKAG